MSSTKKPVIGVVSCAKSLKGYDIQAVNEFYLKAISDFGGVPIILSAAIDVQDFEQVLAMCDGLLFPGSHSNVAPYRYQATHTESYMDERRDELSLSLLRYAVDNNLPCLGICRGFQEMNVALGGSLDPAVHKSGFDDHREPSTEDFAVKYAAAHRVVVESDGVFKTWLQQAHWPQSDAFEVNSLHNQGVKALAPNLKVEAKAPDGLVEAFSLPLHKFFVGVQWHPEWKAKSNHFSQILFKEFILAASL
ncbi:gamma-glutamyl-gamma-aminobutyrate hydrolase [Vibrio xiamenensis]|uniref:gamma-glutamyl-gamma-aminobutyrate hydrolase n=1 Tax=Vibrio xiamenensis TaxID=861298 RepID=A0A1G7WXA3_9VIBR|nr:gamma-glutamyl-gamma-aminobutyrate hydrolase family protein [Vibrio xiamenensis]SDG76534.1 gamma-glutamyl-gamma-aminobutyrate hydrolase [Vibrio xiamenensis]SDG87817.1 gamma-glutamyl-gamma-aminobutyrate hydrolase [Vibrio xiamenensis]